MLKKKKYVVVLQKQVNSYQTVVVEFDKEPTIFELQESARAKATENWFNTGTSIVVSSASNEAGIFYA